MELFNHWNNICPPINELAAIYMGFESTSSPAAPSKMESEFLATTPVRPFSSLPQHIQDALNKGKK